MIGLLKVISAIVIGILLGLLVTIRILDAGNRTIEAGPWQTAANDGTSDIDPYTLAAVDRAGLLPLGSAEGLTFIARSDSGGAAFASACDYVVTGPMPPTRYWTISLLNQDGFPVAGQAERYDFTSADVLRAIDKPVAITIALHARPENWLPSDATGTFVLMLRLYDTGLSTIGTVFNASSMPKITRKGCR